VLSVRDNRLQMAASWFHALQDIKTQEIASARLADGERRPQDEGRRLRRRRTRLRPRRCRAAQLPLPVRLGHPARRRAEEEARGACRLPPVEVRRQEAARDAAARAAAQQADVQEIALKAKVDELLRRARTSYNRQDYKRARSTPGTPMSFDPAARMRASSTSTPPWRHVQFDSEYHEIRLERLARVQEEIHKSMIPQNELLVYPEDWQIRALRKPQEIGNSKVEPWMASLRERLEQRRHLRVLRHQLRGRGQLPAPGHRRDHRHRARCGRGRRRHRHAQGQGHALREP